MSSKMFCSEETLETSLQILSTELSILGFPKFVHDSNYDRTLVVKLVNAFWPVVQTQKLKIQKLNEQSELVLKLQSEIKDSVQKNKRLEVAINCLSNDIEKAKNGLCKAITERDSALKEAKSLKAELAKLNGALVTQRLQHENDLRKKDTLLQNLQSQLMRFMESDQKTHIPVDHASLDTGDKPLQELYLNKYICQLDNNIQMLLMENVSVRCSLFKIVHELVALNKISDSGNEGRNDICIAEHLFSLPYEELLSQIETSTEKMFTNIKTQLLNSNNI